LHDAGEQDHARIAYGITAAKIVDALRSN